MRVGVVQARLGSTRLPGKVLSDLAGRPLLIQLLRRLATCPALDDIVVATSTTVSDDPIADACAREGIRVYRGSDEDVLGRFVGAARAAGADVVVRVTGDCPLIDPEVAARVVNELTSHAATTDYASNVLRRTYPRGLDVEAMFFDTLLRADRLAQTPSEREHVTVAIRSTQHRHFLVRSVESEIDDSDLRWTVDEPRDLQLVRQLYTALDLAGRIVPYRIVVDHVRRHPELAMVNAGVATWSPDPGQREGTEVSAR